MSDLVERLRHIGEIAVGAITEPCGLVWHPANELLQAADEIIALRKRVGELERELAGWKRMMDEALNSGDGSYRP